MRGTLRTAVAKSSAIAAVLASTGAVLAASGLLVTLNKTSNYPEGPLWRDGALYYAEMRNNRVMRYDGKTNTPVWMRPGCGPTSVASGEADTLIVFCHLDDSIVRISLAGETIAIIDKDAGGRGFVTPNASVNDLKGGVYFSSSGNFMPGATGEGSVLYLDKSGSLRRVAEGIDYANGVALSPDGNILFVSEHLARGVLAFKVAADGSLSGRRVFVALDDLETKAPDAGYEVGPDGLAVDHAGNLYIAEYGAGHLLIVSPERKLLATVMVPERYITAPAFGETEERIFITAPGGTAMPAVGGRVYSAPNPVYRGED